MPTQDPAAPRSRRRVVLTAALGVLGVVALILGIVLFTPLLDRPISVKASPAADYAQAQQRAQELLALDGPDIRSDCRSRIIDSGQMTEKAVVLLHGFTNCPAQFAALGQAYADAGYNVVIPRLPGHGYTDRLTDNPSGVTASDLADAGNLAVDVAAGLGDTVEVVGLSGGGTLAGWLASRRDEISEAVLLAPLVVPRILPNYAVAPVARATGFLPDYYVWWDSTQKAALNSPPYAYPRWSLKNMGDFLALGRSTHDGRRTVPLQRLVVITNDNDDAVSNAGVEQVAKHLEAQSLTRVNVEFPADKGFGHDLIDPQGENANNLDEIYPALADALELPGLKAP